MNFEKFNLVDLTIATGLVVSTILAILYGYENLATNIAVGLVGFLGGKVMNKPLDSEQKGKINEYKS